jgi:hypothetical protein
VVDVWCAPAARINLAVVSLDAPVDVSVPCPMCQRTIRVGDDFCTGCGRPVHEEDRVTLQSQVQGQEGKRKVRVATRAIGLAASLVVLSGAIQFVLQQGEAPILLARLHDAPLALRLRIEGEPYRELLAHLGVAALLGGLCLWARRSPLGASAAALGLIVAVSIAPVFIDPAALADGIVLEVVLVALLATAVKVTRRSSVPVVRDERP